MDITLPDLEELRERFKDYNLAAVSRSCGLHYNVVHAFVRQGREPSYETVRKLTNYLASREDVDNG